MLILYDDPWFSPSGSVKKKTIIDEKGKTIEVHESYYRKIRGGEQILIRVSNHGTSLNTWVKRKADPSKSLQNLTVVFSNEPISSKSVIEPIEIEDTDGKYAYNILRLIKIPKAKIRRVFCLVIAFLIFNKTILKLYTFCPAKAKKRNFLPSYFEKNTTFAAVNHNFNRIMDDYYADSNKRN